MHHVLTCHSLRSFFLTLGGSFHGRPVPHIPSLPADPPANARSNARILVVAHRRPRRLTAVALHLTVVTSTTAQSDILGHVRDAHAASVGPNERAVHETTGAHASSSNDR